MRSSFSSGLTYLENVKNLINRMEQAVQTVGRMIIRTYIDEETKISMCNLVGMSSMLFRLHDLIDIPEHMSKYSKLVFFAFYWV